jgi:hypothetical protein
VLVLRGEQSNTNSSFLKLVEKLHLLISLFMCKHLSLHAKNSQHERGWFVEHYVLQGSQARTHCPTEAASLQSSDPATTTKSIQNILGMTRDRAGTTLIVPAEDPFSRRFKVALLCRHVRAEISNPNDSCTCVPFS